LNAIMILGPTAAGKTELLFQLARDYPIEIISLDSRQTYRHMDIGTAKPTPEEQEELPHHLIDICNPDERFDVYRFRELAMGAERKIREQGKIPVFAGGSGLYADSLLRGLVKNVPRNDQVRSALAKLETDYPGLMRRLLLVFDPEAAKRIHPNDVKRTQRYLEAFFVTGKRLSRLQQEETISDRFTVILVDRERSELHSRIAVRVDRMKHVGLTQEVINLVKMGFSCNLNSMRTIGYAEICEYLQGMHDEEKAFELIKRNTRRYARRQIIWFRRYKGALRLNLSNIRQSEISRLFAGVFDSFWGDDHG